MITRMHTMSTLILGLLIILSFPIINLSVSVISTNASDAFRTVQKEIALMFSKLYACMQPTGFLIRYCAHQMACEGALWSSAMVIFGSHWHKV